jgi:Mlc titration factor MtfA (ptsG expression regulator)
MLTALRRWFRPATPTFDPAWESTLRSEFAQWQLFEADELERLRMLVARFVHETDWEAARGMDLTEDVRVVIAAQACVPLLGLEIDEYFDVSSVIVHRSTVKLRGTHRSAAGTMSDAPQHLAGQATPKGPVVLSWSAVRRGARFPQHGENVVYHEFAHRLDMLGGITDGTPPLGSDEAARRWAEVCTPAYERVVAGESVLRSYAATNPAEFFAVATEVFFNRPDVLVQHEQELYAALRAFYRQDTMLRVSVQATS